MNTLTKILIGLLVAALLAIGVQSWRLQRAHAAERGAAIAEANARARADVTRDVTSQIVAQLGDTLRAVERLIEQVAPKMDAIDRTLQRQSQVVANLGLTVQQLAARGSAPVTERPDGVRLASFTVDSAPYHVTAAVELPPAPARGTIDLRVRLDSASLQARVQCGARGRAGVRDATLLLVTPPWLSARVESVQQSPDVCQTPVDRRSWWTGHIEWGLTVTPGITTLIDEQGTLRKGAGVTVSPLTWRYP